MRKFISMVLIVILLLPYPSFVFATEESENLNIESIAIELLSDALARNDCFAFPSLEDKLLYLCEPIYPCYLRNNTFVENKDIAYYLIKTDDTYIANITVCYDEGRFLSAAFSTDIAQTLVANNINSSSIALIPYNGTLYIKTNDSVVFDDATSSIEDKYARSTNSLSSDIVTQFQSIDCDLSPIVHQSVIQLPSTSPVVSRSSSILNVPYISQDQYDICWAAAAGALGQYHTGISYSATELCDLMGVGYVTYGMNVARQLLTQVYSISTTYSGYQLSTNVIINRLNEHKPILVGFSNTSYAHMVVLCGFDYPSTSSYLKYYIRDSNYASMKIIVTLPEADVIMDYYSNYGYLFWTESAYKS